MSFRTCVAVPAFVLLGALTAAALATAAVPPLSVLFLGDRGHHRPADRAAQIIPVMAGRGIEVAYTEKCRDLNPDDAQQIRRPARLCQHDTDRPRPGEGAARLRRRRRRLRPDPLRFVLLPELARVRRPDRRPVPEPRHGRVRHEGRRPRPSDHQGPRTVPHLGRDLRPHQAQHQGPPRPPDPQRPGRLGALDLDAHARQGARLLHRVRPRRPNLGPARLPGPDRAGHPLGGEQGGRVRLPAAGGVGPEALRVRARRDPALHPGGPLGHARRADPQDAAAALAGRVASSTWPCRPASRRSCSSPSRRSPSRSPWPGTTSAGSGSPRRPTTRTRCSRRARAATGSRSSRIPTATARPTRSRVFADNLSIPTSLCFVERRPDRRQAPDMLFLKDTDGDDKADERKVLFTGLGTNDTHAGPSNLRYGLDNWVYGIIGYSGFNGTVGGERHKFRQGFYRFKPDGSKLGVPPQHEQQLVGRRDQRGGPALRLDGQRLPERLHADREPLLRVGPRLVARRSCRTSPTRTGSSRSPRRSARSTGTAASPPAPASPSTRRGLIRSTTGTGPRSSPSRPATWSRRSRCTRTGATSSRTTPGTSSPATTSGPRRSSAEVGPDGHVWMIDWYNFIVQHNPTPEGFRTGKGPAYETPLRDKTHGRIYRVVYKDGKPSDAAEARSEGRPGGARRGAEE